MWLLTSPRLLLLAAGPLAVRSLSTQHFRYLALYKPALTLCSFNIDNGLRTARKHRKPRPTLASLPLPNDTTLHTCGRLDRDSEGLLLLTNDGQFTHSVLSQQCHKTYWVLVQGEPSDEALDELRQGGLEIRGAMTRPPIQVNLLDTNDVASILPPACAGMNRPGTWLEIVLNEGRNRQVRRITRAAGHRTIRLVRVGIGSYSLLDHHLEPGDWMTIRPGEVVDGYDLPQ